MGTKLHYVVAVVIAFVCCWGTTYGQTEVQRLAITKDYNKPKLSTLEQNFRNNFQQKKANAWNLAQQRGWETIIEEPNGGISELIDVTPEGNPIYYSTENAGAAETVNATSLYNGGSLGLNVEGQNMLIGVWDGGRVRTSHELFGGRASQQDNATNLSSHATHVSGTAIGSGSVEGGVARGMAHQAQLHTYDWNNDEAEVAAAAANGLLVSNHSYGVNAGTSSLYYLGYYDANAKNFDAIMHNAPYYQMVCSAGNDQQDNVNTGDNGYDKLTDMSLSKNAIVVGAVSEVLNYSGPSSVLMSDFSTWGPTDDGRVKPDITAKGVGMYSSTSASNISYGTSSGTSMATPSVSGTLLLLQQHYNNVNGNYMRAATLRGLALHTAYEAGNAPGPDYKFGWGLLNAEKAAETINNNGSSSLISEELLLDGATFSTTINATGNESLMVSITWTDKEGNLLPQVVDLSTPSLINDLDIRITKDGQTYFPWKLDPANPEAAATQGDNLVDNIEKIEIPAAVGEYTITVTHKGNLDGGFQNFSLVVTGGTNNTVACVADVPTNVAVPLVGMDSATATWDAITGAAYDVRYKKVTETDFTVSALSTNFIDLDNLDSSTDYEIQVRSNCGNEQSDWSVSTLFTTSEFVLSYCESRGNSTNDEYISRVQLGTLDNASDASGGYADYTALSTDLTEGQEYSIIITPTWTGTVYSEAFSVWIDYNTDGDFDDAGEQVWTKAPSKDTPVSGTFTIPSDAPFGPTRMRVSMKYNGVPSSCESFTYGEVEDYTVNIAEYVDTEPPTTPTNLVTSSVSETSLELSWDVSTDNVGLAGYGVFVNDVLVASTVTNSVFIDNLQIGTVYKLEVAAQDLAGNISPYSEALYVTTLEGGGCVDSDNDGVCNDEDICEGGDDNIDSDGDGIPDFCDTCDEIEIDFNAGIQSYGGSQDKGKFELLDGNTTLHIANNAWKFIDFPYTVTESTVITFDFRSDIEGEIHGIAFDNNNSISSGYTFKVHGTQRWGERDFDNYEGTDWVTYTIPVGDYYTGEFDRIGFVADHDSSPSNGNSFFRNVKVFEDTNGDLVCNDANNGENIRDIQIDGEDIKTVMPVKIYPNPATHVVFAEGIELGTEIEIYNMNGIKVYVGNYEGEINVVSLPQGQYFIRRVGERGIAGKFIKQQ